MTSLAGSLGLEGPAMLLRRRRRIYDGFGRVHKPSIATRSKTSSVGTLESEDTESDFESDSSDYSSSSSSISSSRGIGARSHYFGPQHAFRTDVFDFPRATKATDEAEHSVASGSLRQNGAETTKSVLSLHNLEDLLPSKKALAERYQTSGPGACAHNSEVAQLHGLHDLADLWLVLDMLLKEHVPVQTIPIDIDQNERKGVKVLKPLRRHDSGVDLSAKFGYGGELTAAVKWGQHPLGSAYLVQALFSHFVQAVDVQMLAMMSCLLTLPEPEDTTLAMETEHEGLSTGPGHGYTSGLVSPKGAISARTDYFPSIEVAVSALQAEKNIAVEQIRTGREPPSMASSPGGNNSDPVAPLSSGLTPPVSFRSARRSMDRFDSNSSQPISSSPERMRWPQRQSSNLTNAIASSLPRPFSFSHSASSSPPNMIAKKRTSPMGSFGTSHAQGLVWASNTHVSKSVGAAEQRASSRRSTDPKCQKKRRKPSTSGAPKMTAKLNNQDKFLNDGYADTPFLDDEQEPRYYAYRVAYAELLSAWGLPYVKTEILKYNVSSLAHTNGRHEPTKQSPSHLVIGRKVVPEAPQHDGGNVCLSGVCSACDAPQTLMLGRSVPTNKDRCSVCRSKRAAQKCEFCCELIRGRASSCAVCGHCLHAGCRSMIVESSEDTEKGRCIAGCDCNCSEHVVIEVQWPAEYSAAPVSSTPSTIKEVDEDQASSAWEDVAYESLQKNLGGGQPQDHRGSTGSRPRRRR
jgi:hypothetical protein